MLDAGQVLRAAWQRDEDDPGLRQVRWYRREGVHLVFTPTAAQVDQWTAARERAFNVRAALIERHRDELPELKGETVASWERYYTERNMCEDDIAKAFDAQREAAMNQFHRGDYGWASTLEAAIDELGIPDEEIEGLRRRTEARLAEADAELRRTYTCAH